MFKPLQSFTVSSNSSDITLDNIFDTSNSVYMVIADSLLATSSEGTVSLQLINSSGTLDETAYEYNGYQFTSSAGSTVNFNNTDDTKIDKISGAGPTDGAGGFVMYVFNPGQSGKTFISSQGAYAMNNEAEGFSTKGMQNTAEAHRGLKLTFSNNFDSGNITVYGVY